MPNEVFNRYITKEGIGQEIEKMTTYSYNQRKLFERKWYENNFFDDGYHFRYVSRNTGKIVDVGEMSSLNLPQRAIPKASRQLRGIANLLLAPEPTPSVYPKNVSRSSYQDPNEFAMAQQQASDIAKKQGYWLTDEWKEQHLKEKLILMLILAGKHSVSFMKVWPDSKGSALKTKVCDAFDIYLKGDMQNIQDCPFIIEASPMLFEEVASNPAFDPAQIDKLNADNKMASSEIKQIYMQTRFGQGLTSDAAKSVILKEAFIKETITEENLPSLALIAGDKLQGKNIGDTIMRHSFSANGVWLRDEYLDFDYYPFVDFRYEPGLIYQKPIFENFVPANKSMDILVSRLEKWANTMVTGTWTKRKGESFEITNVPGGQVVEYAQTKPEQVEMAQVPVAMFQLIDLLEKVIEEQGASTSTLGVLPTGVKSGVAIESVKATEYANLKISSDMLTETVRNISEMMLKIADKNYIKPKTVYRMSENGNPEYFDVMGNAGMKARQQLGIPVPTDVVPIDSNVKVDIQIESGMGYTEEGKRQTMQQIVTFLQPLIEQQLVPPESVKILVQELLKTYQFGATQELVEAMGQAVPTMSEDQLMQIKIAVVEAMKDVGAVGPEADQKMVDSTKVGVVEALKDTGMLDKQSDKESDSPSRSISFKDLPPEGKVQLASQAGIEISPEEIKTQEKEAQDAVKNKFPQGSDK